MIARFHYDQATLDRLLHDQLDDDERHVAHHVETCEICQQQIDTLSRQGLSWDEVGELLVSPIAEQGDLSGDETDSVRSAASFLEPTDHPGSLGRFARFEIMEFLGRGGMGIVMRGYDTSLNRHSAVKVLAPELASSAAARKRFSREAKSAAAVVHPHVVSIQTVDEYNGLPYLVMPVVEGQSVDARVRDSGPLAVIETVRIASQIAEGLAAAHEQGLVHRDIKPANVLLENGVERVQITDFGLARSIDDASMTRSGVIAGTPQYMSPEQAHGDMIDHRSDLFSLGSLIYFMLSGRSPFRAETTMGVLNRIVNDEPRSIRSINAEVPDWLGQIVMNLLAKSADNRYQTASEVADLLQSWHAHLQQPDILNRPSVPTARAATCRVTTAPEANANGSPRGPRRWWIATAAFAFLAFAGAMVLEMGKGTIRIESNSNTDIPIRITQGNKTVDELTVSQNGATTRLRAGHYSIEVDSEGTDIQISGDHVFLKRGETWLAKIDVRLEPAKANPKDHHESNETHISSFGESPFQSKSASDGPSALPDVVRQLNLSREAADKSVEHRSSTAEVPAVKVTLKSLSGHPVEGVLIVLEKTGIRASDKSAKSGVAIDRSLPHGTYSLLVRMPDGWITWNQVFVEFGKGLDLTIITPNPGEKSQVVINSKLNADGLKGMPFGRWSEREGPGWLIKFTPEPGEPLEHFASFPMLGDGIEEIALSFSLKLQQSIPQPAGPDLEWHWDPSTNTPGAGHHFLLTRDSISTVKNSRLEYKTPRPGAGYFASKNNNRFHVGGESITQGETSSLKSPYTLQVPTGELTVYIGKLFGRPNDKVRAALGFERSPKAESEQLWLQVNLKADSKWIPRLLNLDGWHRRPKSGLPHLTSWHQSLKPDETATITIAGPTLK